MKKRIIAIALVLMMAVSLLPASAMADDGIFVSIGNKSFTSIDQTLYVGGGKATLTWQTGKTPQLNLENVNLTTFSKLGGDDDGTSYYAGIVFGGNYTLTIVCTNCSITAPTHDSKAIYDGIYAESGIVIRGNLTIKNADIGIEGDGVTTDGATLKISSDIGPAIIGNTITLNGGNCTFDSGYPCVMAGNIIRGTGNLTVNHRPDTAKFGYSSISSIAAVEEVSLSTTTNINLTADLSGYKGSEALVCAAVSSEGKFCQRGPININVNVKGSPNVIVEGIDADNLCFYTNGKTTVNLSLSGSHLRAYCMAGNYLNKGNSVHNYPMIECIIKGAAADDIAFIVTEKPIDYDGGYCLFGEVYCSVDNPAALAMLFSNSYRYVAGFCNGNYTEPLNMNYPAEGMYIDLVMDDESVYRTVADSEGNPATSVFLSNKAYAFRDIDTSGVAPYKTAILWAVDNGITTGFSPVEFRPAASCTRGQVVTFLWRAKGCPEPAITENPFVDVQETSPYYKAILWAFDSGITTGFDATHFKPSNPCTRGQVVTFLWRADGKPAPQSDNNPFKDVSASGNTAPYYDAILWAAESGITSGYSDGTFRPNAICSRGQIVTFIYRDLHEKQIKQRGSIVDVSIDLNPEAYDAKPVKIANNPYENNQQISQFGATWTYVPVNVTATFADGSKQTRTLNMPLYDDNGDFTVPDDFVQLLYNDGSKLYLSRGTTTKNLIVFDFNNAGAYFVSEGMYGTVAEKLEVNGDYIVFRSYYYNSHIYNMKTDELKLVILNSYNKPNGDNFYMVGDTVYAVTVGNSFNVIQDDKLVKVGDYTVYCVSFDDMGPKNPTMIAKYERVASFVFDETGYTVEYFDTDIYGDNYITHYNFPG